MNIVILNGSPRPNGNTISMVNAFVDGAREHGHSIKVVHICRKRIAGCIACEYCHKTGNRVCIQQDDMQEVYPLIDNAEMIVLASPVYYHGFTGQLQSAMSRIYALDKPRHLKKAALILSSGSDDVYDGVIYAYEKSFLEYLELENMGVFTMFEEQNNMEETLQKMNEFGKSIIDTEEINRDDFNNGDRT